MGILAQDTFTRTVSNAFGAASDGLSGSYSTIGTASDYNVNGAKGTVLVAPSAARQATLLSAASTLDSDCQADFTFDTAVTGTGTTGIQFGLEARRTNTQATQNCYRARIMIPPPGAGSELRVRITYVLNNGAEVQIGQTLDSFNASSMVGNVFHLKMRVQGTSPTTISAKYWIDSASEPLTWFVTATDSQATLQAAGMWGFFFNNASTNTSEVVSVDNFSSATIAASTDISPTVPTFAVQVPTPTLDTGQTFYVQDTFTRSVSNGFGTADSGQPWTHWSFAADSRHSVDGSVGRMASAGANTSASQGAGVTFAAPAVDMEAYAEFTIPTMILGATGPYFGLILRSNAPTLTANDYVRVRVQCPVTGPATIWGNAFLAGVSTSLGSQYTLPNTLNPNGFSTPVCLRVQVKGTAPTVLKAKCWNLGDAEPDWQFAPTPFSSGGPTAAGHGGFYGQWSSDTQVGGGGTGFITVDNLSITAIPNIPVVPSFAAAAPPPNVAVFDAGQAIPVCVTPLTQIQWFRDRVVEGQALQGGNMWSRMWATVNQNTFGFRGEAVGNKTAIAEANRRYYSKTYQFTPIAEVNSTNDARNWTDDACAALTLVYRGVVESDGACYTAAKAGVMSWVNTMIWYHSQPPSEQGKLDFHWGWSRMCQAWALLIAIGTPSQAEIIQMRSWIKAVPFRGNTDFNSFVPETNASPATKEAESSIMNWVGAGNWQTGICDGLLTSGVLMASAEGNALIAYAQRYFEHVFAATVYHSTNTYRNNGVTGVPSSPYWKISAAPKFEASIQGIEFADADSSSKSWGFPSWSVAQTALFDGMTQDYSRDQGHDGMTLSHIGRYVLTYILNGLGDPFVNLPWAWAALANGVELKAKVLNEYYDYVWANFPNPPQAADFATVDNSSWVPVTSIDWAAKQFGFYDPAHFNTSRGAPTFTVADSLNGVGNSYFIWDYILRVVQGYSCPNLLRFVQRNRDIQSAFQPRALNGPNAGPTNPSTSYSTSWWSMMFSTDIQFLSVENNAPGVAVLPLVVAPPPVIGQVPDVQFYVQDQIMPTPYRATAIAPDVTASSDPGNPNNTTSAATPKTTGGGYYPTTFKFRQRKGYR